MSGEAAFGLGAMTIFLERKAIVHHSSVSPLRWTRGVSRVERNDRAANAEFLAAQRVVVLGVVAFVSQYTSGPKIHGCLTDSGGEFGRVLTGAARGDGADNQLRSGMKHGREFRPGGVCGCDPATPSLEMHRRVPRFQARRIDRCRSVVVGNQTGCASAIAASGQQLCKPPFSRSFCSTYHSVE